jgi:hypothetical protein
LLHGSSGGLLLLHICILKSSLGRSIIVFTKTIRTSCHQRRSSKSQLTVVVVVVAATSLDDDNNTAIAVVVADPAVH